MAKFKKDSNEKQRQREAMRRLREKIKSDPDLYEENKRKERERYYRRKEQGKIKSVSQLSEREKRIVRKEWRMRSKACYNRKKEERELEKRLIEESPPATPNPEDVPGQLDNSRDGRKRQGRLRRRRHLRNLHDEISNLKKLLMKEKAKKHKYRMRLQRLKQGVPKDSATKNVENLLDGQQVSPAVKKKLLFSEVMGRQLASNYQKLNKNAEKRKFWEHIFGNIVKVYKKENFLKKVTSSYIRKNNSQVRRKTMFNKMKLEIANFLEQNECSRICPGKNDFIKRNGVKKQKRLLNDSLKNLHKKLQTRGVHVSYATFCRLKPFWVIHPRVAERNTCLCITHTNISDNKKT